MRKTITENERLQLLGLLTLGQQHYRMIDLVRDAMTNIIGDEDTLLHDAVWDYDELKKFDKLLKDMGIEVKDATS